MPNPLSADIRTRFRILFEQGLSGREIGRRLLISAASASRLSQKLRRGLQLSPADNPRNTGHGRLAPYHDVLVELIHQDPDITLKELQGALADAHDVKASVSGIDQVLTRCSSDWGTRTKKSLIADERKRAKVKRARADWFAHRVPAISAMPERVVFIDETSVKTNLTRIRGRSMRGTRLTASAPFGSCPFWVLGHPDPDCRPGSIRSYRTLGHQRSHGRPSLYRLHPRSADT